MPAPCDLLVIRAGELATLAGGIRRGAVLRETASIASGAVAVSGGCILAVGPSRRLERAWRARRILDASGRLVTPGLVDPHTHAVFAGDRAREFAWRIEGRSYREIAAAGGGILSTVAATRRAGLGDLVRGLASRLDRMLLHGTTTAEVKSGYGLALAQEIKLLEAVRRVRHPVRRVATFLGAHALPRDFRARRAAYVDAVCDRMIPAVARRGLARYCDVFVDDGAFTLAEGRRVLEAARRAGLGLKVHAEEFVRTGASAMAASLGAASADHLMKASAADLKIMARAGTAAVCLPVTTLFVGEPAYAPARRMVAAGCVVAIATDLNPGSSHAYGMPLAMSLACLGLRLTPAEALAAATINAAAAIGEDGVAGSLEPGKRADLVVWDVPTHVHLPYTMGTPLARTVVAGGRVVVEDGRIKRPARS